MCTSILFLNLVGASTWIRTISNQWPLDDPPRIKTFILYQTNPEIASQCQCYQLPYACAVVYCLPTLRYLFFSELGDKCFGQCCNLYGNDTLHCWQGICQPCYDPYGNWVCRFVYFNRLYKKEGFQFASFIAILILVNLFIIISREISLILDIGLAKLTNGREPIASTVL